MSKKNNGVNYGRTAPQKSRRSRALDMLEKQLVKGTKPSKEEDTKDQPIPLIDKDIKRINKEIGILKARA
tara:strand:+ start:8922 stop:9131 length:210 start_codon:yes stop_codon:yes gene_type:complete